MQKHHNMTFDEIVKEVVRVCKNNKVEHLSLLALMLGELRQREAILILLRMV